jgi:hypothetical protein
MTTTDSAQISGHPKDRYLEAAVPLIAFGVTVAGILLWGAGYTIGFQYFSAGCLISSVILAYLAWTRPRKDIVSLSTPIYGIVFISTPIDAEAGAILQLLYAAGLTILLIRLKRRFSGVPAETRALSSEEPLGAYRDRMHEEIPAVLPELTRMAGRVFVRFAEGEYEQARQFASQLPAIPAGTGSGLLVTAFGIVAEQAGHMTDGSPVPADYHAFSAEQRPLLFHLVSDDMDRDRRYHLELDNALILLYVIALGSQEKEILLVLDQIRPFAIRLCED